MRSIRSRPPEPRVSVIVPARNEARNLEVVLPELPPVHEVVIVDGFSRDDTVETVRRVMPSARLVRQTRPGKGNAMVCGFAEATGDIVVMFDADGSADPGEIPAFVDTLLGGADFAKGSRLRPGGGSEDLTHFRALGNRGLTTVTNLLFRTGYTDLCYGYNAFWADVLPRLSLPPRFPTGPDMVWGDGFEFETVLNCRIASARLRVVEVPSVERNRLHGASNLHAIRDGLRVLRTVVTEHRDRHRHALPRAREMAVVRVRGDRLDLSGEGLDATS